MSLPSGLNAGHQIGLVIDRETLAYSSVKSFDDLPIPFRCVSINLVSGKAHVFDNGPIGLAMRSTMPCLESSLPSTMEIAYMWMVPWWTTCQPTWCAKWSPM